MSLEQVTNVAEILGNFVVVVTLIYLAIQVRQGSAILRSDSRQSQVSTDQNGVYLFVQYPELASYFSQAETPSFEQKAKLSFWIIAQMRAREHEWLQYKSDALDEETWLSYRNVIYFILGTERTQALWEICSQYFNSEFVDMVEQMMDNETDSNEFWSQLESIK